MMNNVTFCNKSSPFNLKLENNKSFDFIKNWKFDKVLMSKKKKRITKVEVYNYFKESDFSKLLKHLQTKKFKYTTDKTSFPREWNAILAQEWKNIIKGWKIVDLSKGYYPYHYKNLYTRVLLYRNKSYLIKAYKNSSHKKTFFKLEITYGFIKGKYNLSSTNWIDGIKSMNSILKNIEFGVKPINFKKNDFSKKITFDSLIFQVVIGLYEWKVNKIENIFKKIYKE